MATVSVSYIALMILFYMQREERDDVIITNTMTGTVSGGIMYFIVNNLDAYSIYVCDVTGSTSAGMGPASRNNSARTGTARKYMLNMLQANQICCSEHHIYRYCVLVDFMFGIAGDR